jgi:hypothetical protein
MFQNLDAVERIFGDRDQVSVFAGLKRTSFARSMRSAADAVAARMVSAGRFSTL